MKTHVRLSSYERGIVEALSDEFGYPPVDARELVVQYIAVVRRLGGYDNARDHASRLHEAKTVGYSAEQWIDRLQDSKRDRALDKGLPNEFGTALAHSR